MKSSNRAKDLDMYDALRDIERLESFENFDIKTFICLTDNKYYSEYTPKGMASSVSLEHGTKYLVNEPLFQRGLVYGKLKEIFRLHFKMN